MIFRIRYRRVGAHVHCRLFAGPGEASLGKCGDLIMREEEFNYFLGAAAFIQFIPEDGETRWSNS